MTICEKGYSVKACTYNEDGQIIAVKIIPESITICPVFNVEIDEEIYFDSRTETIYKLQKNLSKITNEEEEENE